MVENAFVFSQTGEIIHIADGLMRLTLALVGVYAQAGLIGLFRK